MSVLDRLPRELVERVRVQHLLEYANAIGWTIRQIAEGIVRLRKGSREALLPTSEAFADGVERTAQAIAMMAETQRRAPRELLKELTMNQDAKTLSDRLLAALETERRRSAGRRNEICDLKDRLSVALHEIRTLKVRLGEQGPSWRTRKARKANGVPG